MKKCELGFGIQDVMKQREMEPEERIESRDTDEVREWERYCT